MFELGIGPDSSQLDRVYKIVGDVLPTKAIPIAEDSAGNLFLLDCQTGQVAWWDHERELGDDKTEPVAQSFDEFLTRIETDD